MDDQLKTRPSLLLDLRDPDDGQAWSRFVAIYSPLVYRYARRHGLQETDAADVTQEVFSAVARSIRRFDYDRQKGTFRGWLMAVARSKLQDFLARRDGKLVGAGGTAALRRLEEQPSAEDDDAFIEREHRRCLFDWAVEQIRGDFQEATWQAFWQTGVEGKGTKEVAASLGMTVGAVYIARSRVLARLKEILREIEE
ncbi:MAG: sigma-70 family RNA polymerase sigma factor [Pirellulales bacterium]|nr:sigma-70 family RNA polymerase sigma factor [Pirellulales bacterium]